MNFNKHLCLARLKSDNNKQCSRKRKDKNLFCGIHYKFKDTIKRIDINYDLLNDYKMNIKEIIIIQKYIRRFYIKSLNYLKGPALLNRNLSNNKNDFLTCEDITCIDIRQFFSFKDYDGFIYSFNIKSIYHLIKFNKINPYNRNILPKKIIDIVNKLIKQFKIDLQIDFIQTHDPYILMKQECIRIFQKMDELELYTQPEWFLNLNLKKLKKLYLEIKDMWEYRTQLSQSMRNNYVNNGIAFNLKIYHINKITNKLNLQKILIKEISKFVNEGIDKDHCITSCYWILTCLTMVSKSAAEGYPHLVQSHAFNI